MKTNNNSNNYFKVEQKNIIKILSKYDTENVIQKRFDFTRCYETNKNKNIFKTYKNMTTELNLKKGEGKFVVPVLADNKKFLITKGILVIRKDLKKEKEHLKMTTFHELIHAASTAQEILDKKTLSVRIGIYETIYKNNKVLEANDVFEDIDILNEAMTELVSKYIYDQIYGDYKIVDYKYQSGYSRAYFVLAYLLLNYFEKNPKDLFEVYFNGDLDLLDKILQSECQYNLSYLISDVNFAHFSYDNPIKNAEYREFIKNVNRQNPIKNKSVEKQYLLTL